MYRVILEFQCMWSDYVFIQSYHYLLIDSKDFLFFIFYFLEKLRDV